MLASRFVSEDADLWHVYEAGEELSQGGRAIPPHATLTPALRGLRVVMLPHRGDVMMCVSSPELSNPACTMMAGPANSTVFSLGEAGYFCIKIPYLMQLHSGVLLAFGEARGKVGSGKCFDWAATDLVMKRR